MKGTYAASLFSHFLNTV